MNKRALIASIGLFGVGFGLSHRHLARLELEAQGGERARVVVAATPLAAGSLAQAQSLATRSVPAAFRSERGVLVADYEQLIGRRLRVALPADEPILWTDLEDEEDRRARVAERIAAGHRAFVLRPGSADAIGLIEPGDHVDILFTARDGSRSATLLQSVSVIAVGRRVNRHAPSEYRAYGAPSLTLSVPVAEAQLLTQAQQDGHLRVSLRNPEDLARTDGVGDTSAADVQARLTRSERLTRGTHHGR